MADETVVAPDVTGDEPGSDESWTEATVREMRDLGLLPADDAEDGEGEPEAKAEEPKPDAYADFGRRIAEGLERNPVETLRRLQELVAKSDPKAAEKLGQVADEPADDDPLADSEPLTEFERVLWPHARELSETPARVAAAERQLADLVGFSDMTSVAIRAVWDIAQAMLPQGTTLPALDSDAIMKAVNAGEPFEAAYEKAFKAPMLKAVQVRRQVGADRPDGPIGRSGSRALAATTDIGEIMTSDEVENQIAARRARRDGVMRPIGRLRPRGG